MESGTSPIQIRSTNYKTTETERIKLVGILTACAIVIITYRYRFFGYLMSQFPRVKRQNSGHCQITRLYGVGMCRDSSVGIATRYGLDGPQIESRWGRDFPYPSRSALAPTRHPVQRVPGLSREVKRRDVALTTHPHLSAEVMKG